MTTPRHQILSKFDTLDYQSLTTLTDNFDVKDDYDHEENSDKADPKFKRDKKF